MYAGHVIEPSSHLFVFLCRGLTVNCHNGFPAIINEFQCKRKRIRQICINVYSEQGTGHQFGQAYHVEKLTKLTCWLLELDKMSCMVCKAQNELTCCRTGVYCMFGKVVPRAVPALVFQTISNLPSFHSSSAPACRLSPHSSFTFHTNT